MSKGKYYACLGYAALCRAALEVADQARRENRMLPFWREGRVIYDYPVISPEKVAEANAAKLALQS